ncbi:MAG: hypothetical protein K6F33_15730, partial [Bacteroidales bacterium]|nr:hypothetical protein [Bacteroidales bacterium]
DFVRCNGKLIETIRPFLFFYNKLNDYTKHTKKFNHKSTMRFRDALAQAKDPEKTFFEELPEALGFKNTNNYELYGEVLQNAIKEVRMCYPGLIDRIEKRIVEELHLESADYQEYIQEIHQRFSNVKVHLLTPMQREFYGRVLLNFEKRAEWYQAICYPVLSHPLEKLRDEEEDRMLDEIVFLFRECEKYVDISTHIDDNENCEAYSFDMVTNGGTNVRTQTYVLREKDKDIVTDLEKRITDILSGDQNIDICTILKVLEKKIKK